MFLTTQYLQEADELADHIALLDHGRISGRVSLLSQAAADDHDILTTALARWSSFLSASAGVTDIMDAVAEVAERLDRIDEQTRLLGHALHAGKHSLHPLDPRVRELETEITAYYQAADRVLSHIETRSARITFRAEEPRDPRLLVRLEDSAALAPAGRSSTIPDVEESRAGTVNLPRPPSGRSTGQRRRRK
ncbi:hypothetical protein [Microbacterium shaanxiense]